MHLKSTKSYKQIIKAFCKFSTNDNLFIKNDFTCFGQRFPNIRMILIKVILILGFT